MTPRSIADVHMTNEYRTAEQDDQDLGDRRSTLFIVLDHVQRRRLTAVEMLDLVQALGLNAELDELVPTGTERHRLLTEARTAAAELVGESVE